MSPNPSRDTPGGAAYNDIKRIANQEKSSTQDLLVTYAHERFLYRVSTSQYREQLILKGGLMLAVLGSRRTTQDADLLALGRDGSEEAVLKWIREIASADVDDGVEFLVDQAKARPIREDAEYAGVRVLIPAHISKARVTFAVDVNFGDPVTPGAVLADYPQLRDTGTFPLLVYPIETVLAEKILTMVSLGDGNTRERDWADAWRLTKSHDVAGSALGLAMRCTAEYREEPLRPLREQIVDLPRLRAAKYVSWRRGQRDHATQYPTDFAEVVGHVMDFADPVLRGEVNELTWRAARAQWC